MYILATMNTQEDITKIQQFRRELYTILTYRADATMELIDALSSNINARSPIELSLNPVFRRGFSSLPDSIDNFFTAVSSSEWQSERQAQEQRIMRLIARYIDCPKVAKYWTLAIDVTSNPRPFSYTLEDRTLVHQPNTISGNKPITIGHQYSFVVVLPEKENLNEPVWVVPLIVSRVPSNKKPIQVAVEQTKMLLDDKTIPFHNQLCVIDLDSAYSCADYLSPAGEYENSVIVSRLRGNRVLYHQAEVSDEGRTSRGHPRWYGETFSLKDSQTWNEPDETFQTTYTSKRGKKYNVVIQVWYNMLMKGKRDLSMHQHPFTLLRVRLLNPTDGKPVFKREMWLSVSGKRRKEIHPIECWKSYGQRYDEEHFFRFGKQKLLMSSYQTPIAEHEENWFKIVQLAYTQLYLARHLALEILNPWERHLHKSNIKVASPTQTQRDFARIIRQIGTPASVPKPRGKSIGRQKGDTLTPRTRLPIVKKDTFVVKELRL